MEYIKEKKHILVIDDMQPVLKFLQVVLRREGFETILAEGGKAGFEAYQEHQDKIKMIILDLQMPEVSGFDIAREIRKTDTKIPILAQTALAREEDRQNAFEAGCSDFLIKPIDIEQLKEIINKYR